jgi:hypothetical protein
MRTLKKMFLALAIIMVSGIVSAEAQIVVNVRPARPHYVRTVRPGPRHVWVDEEWRPEGGHYVWAGGYWAEPPHPRAAWVPGHWRNTRGGSIWVPGHWR